MAKELSSGALAMLAHSENRIEIVARPPLK
jgi:hypothetical protein